MKGRNARWMGAGFVVTAAIAALALGGSAEAASIGAGRVGPARIATAPNAPAAAGIVLAGFTSQEQPLFFKITNDRRTMLLAGISLEMTCTSGAQFGLSDLFARVQISGAGRLHRAASQPPTAGPNGETYSATDSLTARLNRRHTQLSGVWRLQMSYSFADGMSDHCDSGPVRFAATA